MKLALHSVHFKVGDIDIDIGERVSCCCLGLGLGVLRVDFLRQLADEGELC